MTLEEKLDLPIQNFIFGSWQDFPQVYPNGYPDTSNGIVDVDRHSLFAIYDVVFENPNEYDSGIIKTAGYGFAIVPAHYLAFREYVAGTLPKESYADGDVKRFAEYLSNPDDDGYYLMDTEREPLRYTIDDVTCDGIDEFCILKNDSVLDIYTYDKKDKCIRNIWTGNTDHNECKIEKGTLMFYHKSPGSESDVEEDIRYYVLNTKGDVVFASHVHKNERCVSVNLRNEEENEYEGVYYVDGNNVSRKEYNAACKLYYNPGNISVFDKYEESGHNEIPSISFDNPINVYLNHNGYEYTTGWSVKERREQLGLNGNDAPVEAESNSDQKDIYFDLYTDKIRSLYSEDKADSFALINLDDDNIPELLALKNDNDAYDENTFIYSVSNGSLKEIFAEYTGMYGCYLEIAEKRGFILYGVGDVGNNENIWEYANGNITLVFEGERSGNLNDATGEYVEVYSLAGKDVSKEMYYAERSKYFNGTCTYVSSDGLYLEEYRGEGDSPYTELRDKYCSYEEILKILNRPDESSVTDEKTAREEIFKRFLIDVINKKEPVPDMLEKIYYSNDLGIQYSIVDVTGDGQKELIISGTQYDSGSPINYWWVYGTEGEGIKYMGEMSFYNPENKRVYTKDGTTFEGYTVYEIADGIFVKSFHMGERDTENPSERYYKEDSKGKINSITEKEMKSFRNEFNLGMSKYGTQGKLLIMQNVNDTFGESGGKRSGSDSNREDDEEYIDGDYDSVRKAMNKAGFYAESNSDTFDFWVIVSAPDGGVNVREECGTEYPIIYSMVPNGTRLHVDQVYLNASGSLWAGIDNLEKHGYIALSQVKRE